MPSKIMLFSCVLFLPNLCKAQIDTKLERVNFKIDTLIKDATIGNKHYSITVPYFDSTHHDAYIFGIEIKSTATGKLVFTQKFKENNYSFSKAKSDQLNSKGKLYVSIYEDGGGSGYAGECYQFISTKQNISIQPLYHFDELTIVYFASDNEIIKLEADWNLDEKETHFSNHRYNITKYSYINNKFVATAVGKTKYKYSSLDEGEPVKNILKDIKRKESKLLVKIDL